MGLCGSVSISTWETNLYFLHYNRFGSDLAREGWAALPKPEGLPRVTAMAPQQAYTPSLLSPLTPTPSSASLLPPQSLSATWQLCLEANLSSPLHAFKEQNKHWAGLGLPGPPWALQVPFWGWRWHHSLWIQAHLWSLSHNDVSVLFYPAGLSSGNPQGKALNALIWVVPWGWKYHLFSLYWSSNWKVGLLCSTLPPGAWWEGQRG